MIGSDPLTNENAVSRQNDSTLERELIHSHTEHAHGQQLSAHSHVHDEESQRRIVNRLSRIEGHIRGIKTMVQENRACPDVLVQVAAVRGALESGGANYFR